MNLFCVVFLYGRLTAQQQETVVPGLDAYTIGRLTRVHQLNMEVRWPIPDI